MIKALIIDDDAVFLHRFTDALQKISTELGLSFCLDTTTKPQKLLTAKEDYDMYFFDIIMPEITGIELALKLRNGHNNKEFVFVSNSEQYIRSSMAARPCGFIRKGHLENDLREVLLSLDRLFVLKGATVSLKNNTRAYPVQPQKIIHINSKEHYLCLTYMDGTNVLIRDSMKTAAELLSKFSFLRVNNRCLVNLEYLESCSGNTIVLKNGYTATITNTYLKEAHTILRNIQTERDKT